MSTGTTTFATFSEFYPFYLSQHTNRACRRLHFAGTTLGLAAALHALSTLNFWWLAGGIGLALLGLIIQWAGICPIVKRVWTSNIAPGPATGVARSGLDSLA